MTDNDVTQKTPETTPAQILLLPGFMLTENLWDEVREGLAKFGELSFGDLSQDDSIKAMAERVLAHAPPRFTLIGFSMGGYVAQWLYKLAPERVTALILMNTSAHQQSPAEVARTQAEVNLAKQYPFKGLTRRALTAAVDPARANDQVLLGKLQAMALTNGKDVFIQQLSALRDDGSDDLQHIHCPTLIIASRHDQMRSVAESEAMASRIPNAQLVVFEDCGHMTPLEQPAELLQVLSNWLA